MCIRDSKLGAEYLMEHMKKNLIIGTGWGDSLAILVKMLQPLDLNPDIVQLMGSVTCESISSTPQAVVTAMAEVFHGDVYKRQELSEGAPSWTMTYSGTTTRLRTISPLSPTGLISASAIFGG